MLIVSRLGRQPLRAYDEKVKILPRFSRINFTLPVCKDSMLWVENLVDSLSSIRPSIAWNNSDLQGELALVTGGSSGIGRGFARAFAARGADLVLVGRNRANIESTARQLISEYGVQVECLAADLSTETGQALVLERLQVEPTANKAAVSILVNNAGSGLHQPMDSADPQCLALHQQMIRLMVDAPLLLGMAAAAHFQTRKDGQRGLIINVASVNSLVPMGTYSALKAFLYTWSQALALRLRPTGVQVITFMPGWTRTEHHQRAGISTANIPNFLWLDPDVIAEQAVQAALQGRTYFVPSWRYKILAGAIKITPRPVVGKILGKFNRSRAQASAKLKPKTSER